MSRSDHPRKAKYPEHGDKAPKYQPRPEERRQRTRRQAVLATLRSWLP